jgi:predicted esterase
VAAEPTEHHLAVRRTARYHTLRKGDGVPGVVWVVAHGYGQLAGTFIRYFADLLDDRTQIVAPEALNRCYLVPVTSAPAAERPVGATWMTREDREHEIADYVAYLDALLSMLSTEWGEPRPRIRALGFSQGAATMMRWCGSGHSRVDDWILWGGLVPPDMDLPALAAALDGRKLVIVIGDSDSYLPAATVAAELSRLEAAGIGSQLITFDGGHAIERATLTRLSELLQS